MAGFRSIRASQEVERTNIKTLSVLMGFVVAGDRIGVPVKILRRVFSEYAVTFHNGRAGATTDNEKKVIEYPAGLLNRIRGAAIDGKGTEFKAVGLMYHEATHAWLHLGRKERNNQIRQLLQSAARHYAGGTLKNGRRISDPEGVAEEAMAFYVHWRMLSWWKARQSMTAASLMPVLGAVTRAGAMASYRTAQARRVFGYEDGPGGTIDTDMQIPDVARHYCDRVILEGKIPEKVADLV